MKTQSKRINNKPATLVDHIQSKDVKCLLKMILNDTNYIIQPVKEQFVLEDLLHLPKSLLQHLNSTTCDSMINLQSMLTSLTNKKTINQIITSSMMDDKNRYLAIDQSMASQLIPSRAAAAATSLLLQSILNNAGQFR